MSKGILAGMVILAMLGLMAGTAQAAPEKPAEAWVMCQPDSSVNVRERPNKHSEVVCEAYAGDRITLDGKKQGRWYHCLIPCEAGEGWIRGDFLSFYEPEYWPEGRKFETTAGNLNARFSIRGNIRKRLGKGVTLTVYLCSEEWSVTSQGFIQTKFLMELPEGPEAA